MEITISGAEKLSKFVLGVISLSLNTVYFFLIFHKIIKSANLMHLRTHVCEDRRTKPEGARALPLSGCLK